MRLQLSRQSHLKACLDWRFQSPQWPLSSSLDGAPQSCLSVLVIRLPAFPSDSREQGGGYKVFNDVGSHKLSAVLVLQVHLSVWERTT